MLNVKFFKLKSYMKNLFYLAIALLVIVSCQKEPKDYLTFSGKITDKNSDSIVVFNPKLGYRKVIKVDENGTFKDTLKLQKAVYNIYDGKEYTSVFLRNGADIHLTLNTKEFDESIVYSGKGVDESNFLAQATLKSEAFFAGNNVFKLSEDEFNLKLNSYVDNFNKSIEKKSLDSAFVANEKLKIESTKKSVLAYFKEVLFIKTHLAKGVLSPKFVNYENHKGGTISLDDLKGKYVYIDVWATWCQPCKYEIPYLKKLEEQFRNKNIEFVSISIDKSKDHEVWKQMVTEKELVGVQLFADNSWKSSFVKDYKVSGIPRFILVDKEGYIVDAQAPRPSDPKLLELLTSLKI